jgi:Xaa-Pro aminopeptidase
VVLIDVGVKLGHYCSDMTRTFVFGNASHEFREVYNYLLKLQEETLETVRAGINASLLDRQLRKGLRLKDLEKYYAHSLGHGVGVEVHEEPAISHLRKKEKLERGMLFTIEPGVYIPEKFGIRIEDMVFIDKRGRVEILTQFPKELLEVR